MTDTIRTTNEYGTTTYRNTAGQLHRLDGPAYECANGSREYWVNGQLHRIDGPAVECANGYRSYWVNGVEQEGPPAVDRGDGERLDWLEENLNDEMQFERWSRTAVELNACDSGGVRLVGKGNTVRAALDVAMAQSEVPRADK